jgi:RNA polymerase sigma factor (sigma-70 family)
MKAYPAGLEPISSQRDERCMALATNLHTFLNDSTAPVGGPEEGRESELLASVKGGQTATFADLCQPHTKMILRTAYRITRNREDAEDALQDSLLKAFVHIKDFDGRSNFSTWLTRIAINSALMILRKKRKSPEIPAVGLGDSDATPRCQDVPDSSPNPEKQYLQQEQQLILQGAVQALGPAIRQVFEIQQLQEYSAKETARVMGISVTAAKTRLHRARAALSKSFVSQGTRGSAILNRRTQRNVETSSNPTGGSHGQGKRAA